MFGLFKSVFAAAMHLRSQYNHNGFTKTENFEHSIDYIAFFFSTEHTYVSQNYVLTFENFRKAGQKHFHTYSAKRHQLIALP